MQAEDVKPGMRVVYQGFEKFGNRGPQYGEVMTVASRSWDAGSDMWLFSLDSDWGDSQGRLNVPARWLSAEVSDAQLHHRDAFEQLHARLLRDLPGDASELPPPQDEYWAQRLDDLLTFSIKLHDRAARGA